LTVGELHTHPLSAGEAVGFISAEEADNVRTGKHSAAMPPSGFSMGGDISLWDYSKLQTSLHEFAKKGISVEILKGVVDAAGITYFRPTSEEDIKREFPAYFAELEQRRAIISDWQETVTPLISGLDEATLNELHQFTREKGKYDHSAYRAMDKKIVTEFMQGDLESALHGGQGEEQIAQKLFNDNPKAQKLQDDLKTRVITAKENDETILDEARLEWIKTSLYVPPEQLSSTKAYAKLREAYARNMAYIRFVPHSQVPNEPPCAGTDFKA
jgi:hypothetical protein